jgi:hypothetical protein
VVEDRVSKRIKVPSDPVSSSPRWAMAKRFSTIGRIILFRVGRCRGGSFLHLAKQFQSISSYLRKKRTQSSSGLNALVYDSEALGLAFAFGN